MNTADKMSASQIINEIGRVAVSLLVTGGFFWVLHLWTQMKVDGGTNEVLTMMVGSLTTAFGLVVAHWVNGQVGSSDRRAQNALTDKLADAVAASSPTVAPAAAMAAVVAAAEAAAPAAAAEAAPPAAEIAAPPAVDRELDRRGIPDPTDTPKKDPANG